MFSHHVHPLPFVGDRSTAAGLLLMSCITVVLCGIGITSQCRAAGDSPLLLVKRMSEKIQIDGKLEEGCYKSPPAVAKFAVAGAQDAQPQPTRAWLFWHPERLVFAFEVHDKQIVAASRSDREPDVDAQDRVELFLWSGHKEDTYYCIEIGARGAVHDYAARFYREFDDAWSPAGMQVAVALTPAGYCVEAELPRAAIEAAGFKLHANERLRCGLFRADFVPAEPDNPAWICWVDARGPKPDFHVAQSFGQLCLVDETER